MAEGRLRYQPGLDGVRAFALVAVLAFHDGRLQGGFLGVSTFFTLSGFLITGLLLAERQAAGRVSMRRFFTRRFRRLVPAALLGIVVAGAVTIGLHDAQTAHNFRFDALAAVGDVANWRFLWSGRAYANLFASQSPLLHYWSLALEEQFYLVLAPLIVVLLTITRGRRPWLATAIAALGALSFVDGWMVVHGSVDRAYYGTDTRALEFLVGAFLAVVVSRGAFTPRASRAIASLGPIALVGLAAATVAARVSDAGLFRGGLFLYAIGSGVVVLAACEPGPVRRLCSLAPLRQLGRISYGVYVYHWPVFLWLTPARTNLPSIPLSLLRLAVALALATVSYVLVERPIREGRPVVRPARWAVAPAIGASVAAMVVVVGVVAPAPAVTFAPTRSVASVLASAQRIASRPQPAAPPTTTATPATRSQQSSLQYHVLAGAPTTVAVPDGRAVTTGTTTTVTAAPLRRVLVVGDSVALTLGRGIERWGTAHGVAVLNDGMIGCSLMNGVEVRGYWGTSERAPDPCQTRTTWPAVLKQFTPDVVVVLYGAWDVYDASFDHGHTWLAPGDTKWDDAYTRDVADAARRLHATGAHVLWLTPPCFAAKPGASDGDAPWYDPARVDALRTAERAASVAGMTVSDIAHDAGCPVDLTTRPDGVHYSDAGADAVTRTLAPQLTALGGVSGSHP